MPTIKLIPLNETSTVTVVNVDGKNKYLFNGSTIYDKDVKYTLKKGTYTLFVPADHPIAFLNKIDDKEDSIKYTGPNLAGTKLIRDNPEDPFVLNRYNFYSGKITITVTGDFDKVSAYCYLHGYMGGENIFLYEPDVKPCYNKNTKIKCLVNNTIKSVPVQNLTTETRVLTLNGSKLVTKLTHHVQHNNKNDPNRMFRYKNLLLSGRHRTIVDFKPDKKLNPRTYSCGYSVPCSGDPKFTEVVSDSDFDLYNFTLENTDTNHRDIIEIEGVLVETTSEWYLNKV